MPELPEVETIKLGLQKKIVGLKVKQVEVLYSGKFFGNSKLLEQKKVLKVWRRAKVLGIDLGGNLTILIHLKMTGQLILIQNSERLIGGHPTADMVGKMPNKYTRVIFHFSNHSTLFFNDLRKFGWVRVVETVKALDEPFFKGLGPEPLEETFLLKDFKANLLRHKSMNVKQAILDQKVVAGVGNIYACEALFHAKINPKGKVANLTSPAIKKLFEGIIFALSEGVKYGGSTRQHYVNIDGYRGYFLDRAFVYGREGEACRICGTRISKIKLGGRGTFFCPKCQR